MLRLVNREGCTMDLLYAYMLKVGESLVEVDQLTIEQQQDVAQIWNVWWD